MVAMVFVAGLVLAGCSSGGKSGPSGGATTASNCKDVSADPDFQVFQKDNSFDPDCITAKNTQKLDLENDGSNTHTFTIDGTPIDVTMNPGDTKELDAPGDALAPGTYVFYCRFHGNADGTGMAGHITIV
jgi:plastocyanin